MPSPPVYALALVLLLVSAAAAGSARPHRSRRLLQAAAGENCTLPMAISSSQMQLGSCAGGAVTLPVALGTPAQPQIYLLDTGSNFLWSAVWPNNPGGFAVGSSSSAQVGSNQVEVQSEDGTVVAVEGSDLVSMGSLQGIRSQIYFVQQAVPHLQPLNGVAGLGRSSQHKNFLEKAAADGVLPTSTYILSLSAASPSYFYYGELPASIREESISLPNHSHHEFCLQIIGFSVGGWEYETGIASRAVLDSTTSAFFLNSKIYNAVVARFFQGCLGDSGCQCEQTLTWPTFAFMFPGAEAYIPPQNYVLQLPNSNCTFNFGYLEKEDTFVLGTSFFYGYNITFDKQQDAIGLQGVLTPLQLVNQQVFGTSQWVLLCAMIAIAVYSGWLSLHLRVSRRLKTSRLSQISLAQRFLQSQ